MTSGCFVAVEDMSSRNACRPFESSPRSHRVCAALSFVTTPEGERRKKPAFVVPLGLKNSPFDVDARSERPAENWPLGANTATGAVPAAVPSVWKRRTCPELVNVQAWPTVGPAMTLPQRSADDPGTRSTTVGFA